MNSQVWTTLRCGLAGAEYRPRARVARQQQHPRPTTSALPDRLSTITTASSTPQFCPLAARPCGYRGVGASVAITEMRDRAGETHRSHGIDQGYAVPLHEDASRVHPTELRVLRCAL